MTMYFTPTFDTFIYIFWPISLGYRVFEKMAKLPPPHEAAAHSSKMRPLPSVHGVLSPEVCVGATQVMALETSLK